MAEYFFGKHRPGSGAAIQDLMFHAKFGKPSLEFVCSHEALLHIVIKGGHYNTEFGKIAQLQPAKVSVMV